MTVCIGAKYEGDHTVLEIALANFIGAGLTAFAPLHNISVQRCSGDNGVEFLRQLNRRNSALTEKFVTGAARRIWGSWLKTGQPSSVCTLHLAKLVELLAACNLSPQMLSLIHI